MRWQKLGLLYHLPEGGLHAMLLSHTANPLAVQQSGDVFRIYFNARDKDNRSSIGAVDIDIVQRRIIHEHAEPFFTYGPPGSFYADGVSIGNCCDINGTRRLFFMGWQTPPDAHFRGDMGQLLVNADGSLRLDSPMPLLAADATDPLSISYPWVRPRTGGGYEMWYGSTHSWDAGNGEMLHALHYADSADGQHWNRHGLAVPFVLGTAQAFSRPTVRSDAQGNDEMWFSCRGPHEQYRIGYASRTAGAPWQLALDAAGIGLSPEGWDSEMICYPFVFDHGGKTYMLYNGNGYGKTGFGLAVRAHAA